MAEIDAGAVRRPRADGRRNRALILQAANRILSEKGAGASLDEIAQAAGVGNGTLYRHFPTRAALVQAVCQEDTRHLVEAESRLSATYAPMEALTKWLELFVDYISRKNVIDEAVAAMVSEDADVTGSGASIRTALVRLHDACGGSSHAEFHPSDLLRALAGIGMIAPEPNWDRNAKHVIGIIVAGLRFRTSPA